jgi:ribosomal-protein-alanine N-acetyltransferase
MVDIAVEKVSLTHEKAFVAAAQRSRGLHHPWINPPQTKRDFAEYVERFDADDQNGFVLVHDICGGIAGFVNVANVVQKSLQSASIGFGVFVGHEGRGLMGRGLQAVIDWSFGQRGLHRLEANIQPGNDRSISIVKKLGFEKEGFSPTYLMVDGQWRDHERWALLAMSAK